MEISTEDAVRSSSVQNCHDPIVNGDPMRRCDTSKISLLTDSCTETQNNHIDESTILPTHLLSPHDDTRWVVADLLQNHQQITLQDLSTNATQTLSQEMSIPENQIISQDSSTNANQTLSQEMSILENQITSQDSSTNANQTLSQEILAPENQITSQDLSTNATQTLSQEMSIPENQITLQDPSTNANQTLSQEMSILENQITSQDPSTNANQTLLQEILAPENQITLQDPSTNATQTLSQEILAPENQITLQDPSTNANQTLSQEMSQVQPQQKSLDLTIIQGEESTSCFEISKSQTTHRFNPADLSEEALNETTVRPDEILSYIGEQDIHSQSDISVTNAEKLPSLEDVTHCGDGVKVETQSIAGNEMQPNHRHVAESLVIVSNQKIRIKLKYNMPQIQQSTKQEMPQRSEISENIVDENVELEEQQNQSEETSILTKPDQEEDQALAQDLHRIAATYYFTDKIDDTAKIITPGWVMSEPVDKSLIEVALWNAAEKAKRRIVSDIFRRSRIRFEGKDSYNRKNSSPRNRAPVEAKRKASLVTAIPSADKLLSSPSPHVGTPSSRRTVQPSHDFNVSQPPQSDLVRPTSKKRARDPQSILQSVTSPLIDIDLTGLVNHRVFDSVFTESERKTLCAFLPEPDICDDSSLRRFFISPEFKQALSEYQSQLSQGFFDPAQAPCIQFLRQKEKKRAAMSAGKSRARYERHLAEWERSRKSITMPHDVGSAGHGIPSSKIKSRTAVVLESKSPWTAVGTTLISPDADSKATQDHISEEAISGNLDTNELTVGTLKMNDDGSNTEMEASEHIQADTDMDLEVAVEIGTAFESEYTKERIEHDTQDPTESQS